VKKILQNTHLCQNLFLNLSIELSSPNVWDASVVSKFLPKVNNHPLGEYSPNLVTLIEMKKERFGTLPFSLLSLGPLGPFRKLSFWSINVGSIPRQVRKC
jgi:hypothetical protein